MDVQKMASETTYPIESAIPQVEVLLSGQTVAEERINTWTHGIGMVLAIIGFGALALKAAKHGGFLEILSCSIYATTLVMMFASSTIYHSRKDGRWKNIFQVSDHISIYLLIAGSYTPYAFVVLKQENGGFLLWLMWGIALFGTMYKLTSFGRFPGLSLALYLGMGWSGALVFEPLRHALPSVSFWLLVSGGLFYSLGTIFYASKKIPYGHCIWHLFVMAGAASHFFSIYYAFPAIG